MWGAGGLEKRGGAPRLRDADALTPGGFGRDIMALCIMSKCGGNGGGRGKGKGGKGERFLGRGKLGRDIMALCIMSKCRRSRLVSEK